MYDQLALGRLLEEKPPKGAQQSASKKSKGPITLGLTEATQPAPTPRADAHKTPQVLEGGAPAGMAGILVAQPLRDRKSTRLNSSHANISYAVFCLQKKK